MNYQMSARNNFLNGLENQKSGLEERTTHIGRFCWQPSDPLQNLLDIAAKRYAEHFLVD